MPSVPARRPTTAQRSPGPGFGLAAALACAQLLVSTACAVEPSGREPGRSGFSLAGGEVFGALVAGPAEATQRAPAAAFGDGHWLVAWQDARPGASGIRAARVTPSGIVLDVGGIAVSRRAQSDVRPAVTFDGTQFWVAWRDTRDDSAGDLRGLRIAPDGRVLDPVDGVLLLSAFGRQSDPALVTGDDGRVLMVWVDERSSKPAIGAIFLNADGSAPSGANVVFADVGATSFATEAPSVVAYEGGYAVSWSSKRNPAANWRVELMRLGVDGARVGATLQVPRASTQVEQRRPCITQREGRLLVAWGEGSTSVGTQSLRAARLTTAGVWEDASSLQLATTPFEVAPHCAPASDEGFAVHWTSDPAQSPMALQVARVGMDGALLDAPGAVVLEGRSLALGTGTAWPASEPGGLIVWSEERHAGSGVDVFASPQRLLTDPPDFTGWNVTLSAASQAGPTLVETEEGAWLAWAELRGGEWELRTSAREADGGWSSVEGHAVGAASSPVVSIAHAGGTGLLAWPAPVDGGTQYVALPLGAGAVPASATPLPFGPAGRGPVRLASAADGGHHAVWGRTQRRSTIDVAWQVHWNVLSPDGVPRDAAPLTLVSGEYAGASSFALPEDRLATVSCGAGACLASWFSMSGGVPRLQGAHLPTASIDVESRALHPEGAPRLFTPIEGAGDGRHAWTLWQQADGGTHWSAGRTRFEDGTPVEAVVRTLTADPASPGRADLAFGADGRGLLVWLDSRDEAPGLYATFLEPGGSAETPAGWPIALGTMRSSTVDVAALPTGGYLVTYERLETAPFEVTRVVVVPVATGPGTPGSACSEAEPCSTGECLDSRCVVIEPDVEPDAGTERSEPYTYQVGCSAAPGHPAAWWVLGLLVIGTSAGRRQRVLVSGTHRRKGHGLPRR